MAETVSLTFDEFEPVLKLGLWPDLGRPLLDQFGAAAGVLDEAAVRAFTCGGSLAMGLALHELLGGSLLLCVFGPTAWPAAGRRWVRTQHVVLSAGSRWWDVGGPRRRREFAPGRRSGWSVEVVPLDLDLLASGFDYHEAPEPEGCHSLNSSAGLVLGAGWLAEARSMVPAVIGQHPVAARRRMAGEAEQRRPLIA